MELRLLISSVQFSCSVVSDSLWSHGQQHTRPPCPSPTPGVYSNSCPLSWWYHPTISSSVVPFSSCLQSFPASGTFQMSQLFASDGQSIGVSGSAPVLPKSIQGWFNKEFKNSPHQKKNKIFGTFLMVQWLRLHASRTEDPGLIRGQATRSHMPQLRPDIAKWINNFFY